MQRFCIASAKTNFSPQFWECFCFVQGGQHTGRIWSKTFVAGMSENSSYATPVRKQPTRHLCENSPCDDIPCFWAVSTLCLFQHSFRNVFASSAFRLFQHCACFKATLWEDSVIGYWTPRMALTRDESLDQNGARVKTERIDI